MRHIIFVGFILFYAAKLWGQPNYQIKKAVDATFKIDGILSEKSWTEAMAASDFQQYFPSDSVLADFQTQFFFTYDEDNLYFAARLDNVNNEREYVTPSLRRDYRGNIDGITLEIDPFQDNTNAFQFGINPFGIQREGLIVNGGQRGNDLSLSWDNKWYAEATQHEGYWIAEAAIPFKTLRFKEGSDKWNINVYRIDTQTGERSTWTPIQRQFLILSLAFMKELVWDQPLAKAGPNISLIPYVASNLEADFDVSSDYSSGISTGLDAKIAVTSGLNLDLTVNPDFSQVELDEQVTNLDRFELFFPERRQFFLENDDLFSNSGHPNLARPFFSRRIGVARDTSTGVNVQNKINFGARLSGKLNNNWRIGVLAMQEDKIPDINKPTTNYSVGILQRKIFKRSSISAIMVNKDPVSGSLSSDSLSLESYNRVAGLDYILSSADAKWYGKFFYHRSFDDNPQPGQDAYLGFISYNSNTWTYSLAAVGVGENYDAAVGFVPRQGIFRLNPDFGYNFFPKRSIFNLITVKIETEQIWNNNRRSDYKNSLNFESGLINTGRLSFSLNQRYTYLFSDFDPTNTDGQSLLEGSDYIYNSFEFNYQGDQRKLFAADLGGYIGQYFSGSRYSIRTVLRYRWQPYFAIRMQASYNRLNMPAPLKNTDLFLIGPRVDLTFTRSLFLTSFFQYNSQIENLNINARLQWRFKPVSDLFIVYTDNYGTEQLGDLGFQAKNRALIMKLTYWFNL
ncbi:MAG: hypothetical protein ACI8QD_000377 [Cyclobacteriaceae bacterium]|jgi:hypothetical protein